MKTTGLLAVFTLAFFSAEAQDTTVAVNPDRDIPMVQDLAIVAPGDAVSSAEPSQSSLPWQRLEARGISPHIAMIVDWSKNFRGGACSRGSVPRQLFKSSLTVDSDRSLGWKGGTGYASLYYHTGRNGGDDTGDAQGFSNIDAPARTYLYELWFQQELLRGKLRLKAGKVDSNTEFAVVENGADFLNSSMGYSPTILGFATYPQPRPSVNVFYQASKHIFAKAGLYDVPGAGAMPVAEGGRTWAVTSRELEGRLSAGFWRQTGKMECFDGDEAAGTGGFYLIAEQMVWRGEPAPSSGGTPHAEETSQPNVAVFWQYGTANGDISRFTKHVGGGVVWRGPLARRRADVLGFGATWVVLHNEPETALNRPSELTLESFYKIRITRFLNLVPDFQFIHLPGGLSAQRDCLVATPRLTITF